MKAITILKFVQNLNVLREVPNMKLLENRSGESHLRRCGTKGVKKLIVAFRFTIALSWHMDSTSSLQEIISSF